VKYLYICIRNDGGNTVTSWRCVGALFRLAVLNSASLYQIAIFFTCLSNFCYYSHVITRKSYKKDKYNIDVMNANGTNQQRVAVHMFWSGMR
jgi:hypothetical protein